MFLSVATFSSPFLLVDGKNLFDEKENRVVKMVEFGLEIRVDTEKIGNFA